MLVMLKVMPPQQHDAHVSCNVFLRCQEKKHHMLTCATHHALMLKNSAIVHLPHVMFCQVFRTLLYSVCHLKLLSIGLLDHPLLWLHHTLTGGVRGENGGRKA